MSFADDLKELIGHKITLDIQIGYEDDPFYTGILEEVGDDYLTIKPSYPAKEPSEVEEQLWIKMEAAPIAHARGYCRLCDAKPASQPVV